MISIRYNLQSVRNTVRRIAPAVLRAAIPRDGSDAAEIRLSHMGAQEDGVGASPVFAGFTKWKVTTDISETEDGDWIGLVRWHLYGFDGTYPALVDYQGLVPPSAAPTFWPDEAQAMQCAIDCANILREQMADYFHNQEGDDAGQRQE